MDLLSSFTEVIERKLLDFLDGISVKVNDCNLKQDIEMLRQQTVQGVDFVSTSEFTTLTIYTCRINCM